MGKCTFVLFRNFFHFKWRANLVVFLTFFTKQLRYATYDLEICCLYLGCIKHTNISFVKLLANNNNNDNNTEY